MPGKSPSPSPSPSPSALPRVEVRATSGSLRDALDFLEKRPNGMGETRRERVWTPSPPRLQSALANLQDIR